MKAIRCMKAVFRPLTIALALGAVAGAQAATTLTVASFPSFDDSVKVAIPLYKKLHPEIEIKLVSLAYGDHHTAMTTALATGSGLPDVMGVEIAYIGKFAESGGLEDLNKPPYSAQQYRNQFLRFTYPQATSPSGKLAALPADVGPGTLFYRKDIMDKAGVTEKDLTTSWESFIESGKKVKAATGAYLIADASDMSSIYIRSNLKDGEGIYFDSKGSPLLTTPRFKKAFELAQAARKAGIDGKIAAWSNEWSEGFKRGQLATQMTGAWLAGHLESWLAPDTKGLWRAAQLPNGAYASWGGSFYSIPSKSEHKKEAWEFIKFMCMNKEMQLAAFKKVAAYPALIGAQDKEFLAEPIPFLGGQPARKLWEVSAAKIPGLPVGKYDSVAQDVVGTALNDVLEQGKDITAALNEAQDKLKKRMRR
ncbi:ABC transporter substrate-binding protein [Uliginosibacterium gangwonense]|uniref:ABC transporter substrate-binding protein n=1 Tax=Uliginosibacterium gangwonense TaxID=392736 RepID=UPI00037EC43E|nr:sugar ABC transporter substrate-binding protein [Uliginosibacterium gangwonense]